MESTEKNSKRGRRSTRLAIWGILLPALVVATVMLLVKLEAGRAEQREAAERLGAATKQKLAFIGGTQNDEHVPADKKKLEQEVKIWFNEGAKAANLQLQCDFVDLAKESSNKYVGLAELTKGESTNIVAIEVTTDNEGHLLNLKIIEPREQVDEEAEVNNTEETQQDRLITRVKNGILFGYEQTTIGRAFDTYFESPQWKLESSENGVKFIEFSGKLKDHISLTIFWEKGVKVFVRFAFSYDFTSFELFSVKVPFTSAGIGFELKSSAWEDSELITDFLDEIYAIQ